MPKKTLHDSKEEALLQLCNIVNVRDVSDIKDLGDGEILLQTIKEKFKLDVKDDSFEKMDTSKEKENVLEDENKSSCDSSDKEKNDILLRYIEIQKFIDDHYQIKSDDIILYEKCIEQDKFELAKVITFVLCELVKLLLQINNQDLQTLFHLEVKHQVELEDIFKVFISDRNKLKKETIEKLLSKSAKTLSPYVTPRRTSLRHRDQTSTPEPPKEDVFTNSPLKNYFESPIFKKENFWLKKQIESLAKTMEEDEEESLKRQSKVSEMEKIIAKKEKYIRSLEKKLNDLKEELQERYEIMEIKEEAMKEAIEKLKVQLKDSYDRQVEKAMILQERDKLIEELKNRKVERKSFSQQFPTTASHSHLSPNRIAETLQEEVAVLKEKNKNLELKLHTCKKQLSANMCKEFSKKSSPGKEENLAKVIDIDNRSLFAKLNEANERIEQLLEEIERLKAFNINQRLHEEKEINSVASTSKTPETEKIRKSLSQSNVEQNHLSDESSYILNNSDNLMSCEQSIISAESEVLPTPIKPSEAVLWKMYDSEKSETESTNAINLNHDTLASEISHLDVISDSGMDNIESNGLVSQENKYVLGNLNFDIFLNELKKLTKNGSFQKVRQVFGKLQNEINGPNTSNQLGLQEMLQVITECVCVAVTLNAEASFANHQDKCCWTSEDEFCTINQDVEDKMSNELKVASPKPEVEFQEIEKESEKLKHEISSLELNYQDKCCGTNEDEFCTVATEADKSSNQLKAVCQKLKMELKEHKKELEKLKHDKISLQYKCQTYNQKISKNNETICEISGKLEGQQIKIQKLSHKYDACKGVIENLHMRNKKLVENISQWKKVYSILKRKCDMLEGKNKKLTEEKEKIIKEKEEILKQKVLKEQEEKTTVPVASSSKTTGLPLNFSVRSELSSTSNTDTCALFKNLSCYVSENEEDIFSLNKLENGDRVEEIRRRNSLYPSHLQSSYPIEIDLKSSYDDLYVKDKDKSNCECQQLSKKRKTDDYYCAPSYSTPSTSYLKSKKRVFSTPVRFQKLMKNMKNRRMF